MEERKNCWWIPLLGLLGLAFLGWLAAYSGDRAKKMQEETRQLSQDALTANGFGYATVEHDGTNLVVRGTAPDAAARDAACAAAKEGAKGRLGVPGVFASVKCLITVPGEPAVAEAPKPAAPAPIGPVTADTCQADLTKAANSGAVNFAKKGTAIASGQNILDQVADIAKKCSKFKIEVGGHTDTGGGDAMNQALSEQRANAVRSYLITKGVPETQLTAKGYGESKPLVNDFPNGREDLAARAKNRRTEFVITASN